MPNPADNLKMVMDYFGIASRDLAKALGVDPSLVSRWQSGQRRLAAANPSMDALSEYILMRGNRVQDIEWLQAQFEKSGLTTDIATVYRTKQNLILWLATDGEALRRNLGNSPSAAKATHAAQNIAPPPAAQKDGHIIVGCLAIALALQPLLLALPPDSVVDIFLSSDEMISIVSEEVSQQLLDMVEKNRLRIRLQVCVSGNTTAISRLIQTYMHPLVSGHIRLLATYGMTQDITRQMHLLLPGEHAMLITETSENAAPPVAVVVGEPVFVQEVKKSFERSLRFAQPIITIYDDNYSRNILEILYMEFAMPGNLDVIKDSVNPLYMTTDAYDRVLSVQGHTGDEFAWRSAEFVRFKFGLNQALAGDTVFREILSLSRLARIVAEGSCRLPGLYFMKKGFVDLDAEGCAAILSGYIGCLSAVPNFHLRILDDLTLLHSDSCWHIKQNRSVGINDWSGDEPVMVHSDQLLMLREFQAHFDSLWKQGEGCIGSRSGVIAILKDVLSRLKRRYGLTLPEKWA